METRNIDFTHLLIYAIPTIFCLILAGMHFYEASSIAYYRDNGQVVKGKLIEKDKRSDSDDNLEYYGKYEYEVDGVKYSVWTSEGASNSWYVYDEEYVYYNPKNPKKARIEIDTKYIRRDIIMGVLFLVAAIAISYASYRWLKKCNIL